MPHQTEHESELLYGKLSWTALLDKISAQTKNKGTWKHLPAEQAAIQAVENRLKMALPEDYTTFLLTTNGLECFSNTGVTLAPVEQVDFLLKADPYLIEKWAEDGPDNVFTNKLMSSIIIGGLHQKQQLLLIPLADNQWECWHFSSWRPGELVYKSFRRYMEMELWELETKK